MVQGSKFTRVKANPKRLVQSRFLLTVNTNRAYYDREALNRDKQKLEGIVNSITDNAEDYLELYRNTQDNYVKINATPEEVSSKIESGTTDNVVEIGGKFGKLHSHTYIVITHSPDYAFRMNLQALRRVIPWYVNVRFIKDAGFSLEKYIRKTTNV